MRLIPLAVILKTLSFIPAGKTHNCGTTEPSGHTRLRKQYNATKGRPLETAPAIELPKIGFGTYRLNGESGAAKIQAAIGAGYRLLDSAFSYENEGAVGYAVRHCDVPREELIVTSKVPGRHHAYENAKQTIEESLLRTGLDYLDLYLIHWPLPKQNRYVEAWNALIDAQSRGLVRWIGVSNFLPVHLERLKQETGIVPAVNQIQLSPYYPDVSAVDVNTAEGIITEAWSPLGRGGDLLADPVIGRIAEERQASAAQIILAWHIARGIVPIPKSQSLQRQVENLAATKITLTPEEVATITSLGRPDGRALDLDPAEHEEY